MNELLNRNLRNAINVIANQGGRRRTVDEMDDDQRKAVMAKMRGGGGGGSRGGYGGGGGGGSGSRSGTDRAEPTRRAAGQGAKARDRMIQALKDEGWYAEMRMQGQTGLNSGLGPLDMLADTALAEIERIGLENGIVGASLWTLALAAVSPNPANFLKRAGIKNADDIAAKLAKSPYRAEWDDLAKQMDSGHASMADGVADLSSQKMRETAGKYGTKADNAAKAADDLTEYRVYPDGSVRSVDDISGTRGVINADSDDFITIKARNEDDALRKVEEIGQIKGGADDIADDDFLKPPSWWDKKTDVGDFSITHKIAYGELPTEKQIDEFLKYKASKSAATKADDAVFTLIPGKEPDYNLIFKKAAEPGRHPDDIYVKTADFANEHMVMRDRYPSSAELTDFLNGKAASPATISAAVRPDPLAEAARLTPNRPASELGYFTSKTVGQLHADLAAEKLLYEQAMQQTIAAGKHIPGTPPALYGNAARAFEDFVIENAQYHTPNTKVNAMNDSPARFLVNAIRVALTPDQVIANGPGGALTDQQRKAMFAKQGGRGGGYGRTTPFSPAPMPISSGGGQKHTLHTGGTPYFDERTGKYIDQPGSPGGKNPLSGKPPVFQSPSGGTGGASYPPGTFKTPPNQQPVYSFPGMPSTNPRLIPVTPSTDGTTTIYRDGKTGEITRIVRPPGSTLPQPKAPPAYTPPNKNGIGTWNPNQPYVPGQPRIGFDGRPIYGPAPGEPGYIPPMRVPPVSPPPTNPGIRDRY